ncbi:uncharacterized protein VTP21DRAFT_9578 [Calcarisporiella thermophila]|uniref:uncharacterized protein n=1 Tax=Calcarisporiella thermophila TaxID=911321 RepID=UPI00374211C0
MPSRRNRKILEQEEEEGEEEELSTRSQRERNGRSEADGERGQSTLPNLKRQRIQTELSSDTDGFVNGSIVRVSLVNFVTYDKCEFRPGPHMNMIIGPNGSGKSSIVCAIALGLGWNTSLLGRAKDISEFVKKGKERASIEIELKRRGGNVIIKRLINLKDNHSVWKLNGQPSTHREVVTKINSLHIQIDNLCQFLPQDKVSEFAQMTPPQLLRATEEAAGEKRMVEMQDKLIQLREQEKAFTSSLNLERSELKGLENGIQLLERDMLRHKQREKILRKIRVIEMRIPFAKYGIAKKAYDEAKQERNAANHELNRIKSQAQPAQEQISELKRSLEHANALKATLRQQTTRLQSQMTQKINSLEKSEAECDDQRKQLQLIRKQEKEHQQKIVNLRNNIETLEVQVAQGPPDSDTSEIQSEIHQITTQLREVVAQVEDLQNEQREIAQEGKKINSQINEKLNRRRELDNVRIRRLEALKRQDPAVFKAYEIAQEHKDQFDKPVLGPICLELNIRDKRFVGAIESTLGNAILKTFVCQTVADYRRFTRELIDKRKMRLNVVAFPDRTMADYRPPVPVEEITKLGLENYLISYVEAPPPVLVTLCEQKRLHAIPISPNEKVDHRLIAQNSQLNQYIAADEFFSIKFSRYGNKTPSTISSEVRAGRFLVDSVDMDVIRQVEQEIDDLRTQLTTNEGRIRNLKAKENELRVQDKELRARKDALSARKREIQKKVQEFEALKLRLESLKTNLQQEESSPERYRREEEKVRQIIHRLAVKRSKMILELEQMLKDSADLSHRRNIADLHSIQLESDLNALDALFHRHNSALHDANRRFLEASKAFSEAKAHAMKLLEVANAQVKNLDEETKIEFQQMGNDIPLETLEEMLISERAKAELNLGTDPRVIQQYETRKKEIENRQRSIEKKESTCSHIQAELGKLRKEWEDGLDNLVRRISEGFSQSFDRIGCAGEVHLKKEEDFDKWGIEILVKFRDHERLQPLTGQRQSGGERSVSTILYLMALQGLTKSPFRVVDEINQGMDPRNERLIHTLIVETVCRPGTAQYFLITPKLLPDLTYHDRMKILCVYNGEWQPDKLHLKDIVARQLRQVREGR